MLIRGLTKYLFQLESDILVSFQKMFDTLLSAFNKKDNYVLIRCHTLIKCIGKLDCGL